MSARILIVDDDPVLMETITSILWSKDYQIISASNGIEGLEMARNQSPDLIILDIMMPGMDGYEVCRRLKADPATADISVLMLSARGDIDNKELVKLVGNFTRLKE